MRNKIMMMVLLCALLVGLVPPSSARADDIYDGPELNYKSSWDEISKFGQSYTTIPTYLDNNGMGLDKYPYEAVFTEVYNTNTRVKVMRSDYPFEIYKSGSYWRIGSSNDSAEVICYENWYGTSNVTVNTDWIYLNLDGYTPRMFYSSHDIYHRGTDVLWYDGMDIETLEYTFTQWCSDAGLNCSFADLDGNVVECRYTDMLVVRQGAHVVGGNGYYLTQVNIAEDSAIFPTLIDWHIGLATMSNDWLGYYVKQYVYDYFDGRWEMCDDVVTQEVKVGSPVPSVGCALSDSVGLVFSNRDLYASDYGVAFEKSEVFASEPFYAPSVPQEPSVTPSPSNPSGGSGVQEQVLYLYPSDFQGTIVTSSASIYDVTNGSDDDILVDILKGMHVDVHGWTVDSSGSTWYYCTYTNIYNGEVTGEFTGFIRGDSVGITNGAGGTEEEQDMTLAEQLQIAASFVLSVPLIIGSIFSFLPPWCLTFLGLAFSVTALLMVLRK